MIKKSAKKILFLTFLIASALFLSVLFLINNGRIHKVSFDESKNLYSCEFRGQLRHFSVFFPDHYTKKDQVPLVIMLHGYGSDGKAFSKYTGFHEPANTRGFAVVYVDGTANPNVSASATGWISDNSAYGKKDGDFLEALAEYLQKNYGFDSKRTFAAGYSNGAFMCHKLALEKGRTFKGIASVAGMMPLSVWENRKIPKRKTSAFLQINGTKDNVTPMKINNSAQFNPNPAMEEVLGYFLGAGKEVVVPQKSAENAEGLEPLEIKVLSEKASLYEYGPGVEWVLIEDGFHSWPEEKTSGINVNNLILDFFEGL